MDTTTHLPTLGAQPGLGGPSAGAGRRDLPGLRLRLPEGSRILREALTFGAIGVHPTVLVPTRTERTVR